MKTCGIDLGASPLENGRCSFTVWAPFVEKMEVRLVSPKERSTAMKKDAEGYHFAVLDDAGPGTRYFYKLDGKNERPDPASRFQPEDVHGPSEVLDPRFPWEDQAWFNLPLQDYVIYELHIGAFTEEGTFDAVAGRLDDLKDLGVTAVEIMPVAQFPGNRNWGYDGVYPFAAQASYGGPEGLRRLVNASHAKGLAVILDVVYNHLGPEGSYIREFGPYFTDRYRTPWGDAINFDGAYSDHVRRFFIENALYWLTYFHIDALRLDAVHAILDHSPTPFLQELGLAVEEQSRRLNRPLYLMPESASNDSRIIRPLEQGGFGLDCQWNDDFHHAVHALLTKERFGYYRDFGRFRDIVKAYREGFVYSGQYSPYRRRRHGNSSLDVPADRFVVFVQNHDQVGNRMRGERLSVLISFEGQKLAAGALLLSPFIPLLFMGEEYGETAPFPYFISHTDPDMVEAVRKGRKEEFSAFDWEEEPPDPQDEATFKRAKLNRSLRLGEGRNKILYALYRELIKIRKSIESLATLKKDRMEVTAFELEKALLVRRWSFSDEVFVFFNFSEDQVSKAIPLPEAKWEMRIDSAEERWGGPGSSNDATLSSEGERASLTLSPLSFALFHRDI